jgi:purine-nucleoside phosphorylase
VSAEGDAPIVSVAAHAAAALIRMAAGDAPIDLAIVLGTGLGPLADAIVDPVIVPYGGLPGFPGGAGVTGHAKRLVIGGLEGRRVMAFQGRAHYYETGDPNAMRAPLQTLAALGVTTVLLTNSAGSLRPAWGPGTIALIGDHIAFSGLNPLIGTQGDARFVPMTDAYDPSLRAAITAAAAAEAIPLPEGVYMWFSGPSFETPAEIRMAQAMGADLVGMSTVPETIRARYLGLKVVALSSITNLGAGIGGANPSHAETKDVAAGLAATLTRLVRRFVKDMPGHG